MRTIADTTKKRLAILAEECGICYSIKEIEDDGTIVTEEIQSRGLLGMGMTYKKVDFLTAIMTIATRISSQASDDELGAMKKAGCEDILHNLGTLDPTRTVRNLMAFASLESLPKAAKPQNQGPSKEELERREKEKAAKQKEAEEAKAKKQKEAEEAKEKKEKERQERQQQQQPQQQQKDTGRTLPWRTISVDDNGREKETIVFMPESKIAEKVIDHIASGGAVELL